MKEIVVNQDKDIVIRDKISQKQDGSKGMLVRADFSLIEVPLELKLEGLDKKEEKAREQELPLAVCNNAIVEQAASLSAEIISGDRVVSGVDSLSGDYFLKRDKVIKLSEDIDNEKACFIGFGANALHAIRKANLELGDRVAVFGQGLSGALTAQIAREAGADVVAIDADENRLNIARQSGIKSVVFTEENSVDKVREFSGGIGVDIVFITAKIVSKNLWEYVWMIVRPEGTIVITRAQDINFDYQLLSEKNINVRVCVGYKMWEDYFPADNIIHPVSYVRWDLRKDLEEIKNMIGDNRISTDLLITQRIKIEKNKELITIPLGRKNNQIGILLRFS